MPKLSGETKIRDLLAKYPFLEDFLVAYNPKFEMLRSRMARATIGRVATLQAVARIGGIELDRLLADLEAEIARHEGAAGSAAEGSDQDQAAGDAPATREERIQALKEIIEFLHAGGDLAEARRRFAAAVKDVEASEIAEMEEALIRGGLPVAEVQRLCDVHVSAFRLALDEHEEVEAPPGHPVHTYQAANQRITELAERLAALARTEESAPPDFAEAEQVMDALGGVENHYRRKENQLFPLLERHGITGPSKVMWGVHDEIRAEMKRVRAAIREQDAATFRTAATALSRSLIEMVYKEEKILFPLAMETLSDAEWAELRRGEDELGYVLAQPAAPWPPEGAPGAPPESRPAGPAGALRLETGVLSLEQIELLFAHLPVDLTFVDETDTVRFYSEGGKRIFPRSPAVIGRKVQNCHPPKSLDVVTRILDTFRDGSRDTAEFWIRLEGRLIHIRYFAVRDAKGAYRGCLEVTQDVTEIQKLEGERRLLDWE